ncbi:GTD2A protein, partial [Amia calva]|nr:GTD2A protein [Amia calva]
ATRASYIVAHEIAKRSKPFSDGEFIKCPEQKTAFQHISLSNMTVTCRIEDIGSNLKSQLIERSEKLGAFSIALDESTDISDTAQLLIFIWSVVENFQISEDLLILESLKGRTRGCTLCYNYLNMKLQGHGKLISDLSDSVKSFERKLQLLKGQLKDDGSADTISAAQVIQRDLDYIQLWADIWQMKFNVEKCKVLHAGNKNVHYNYAMGGIELDEVMHEKDLGVYVDASLSPSKQCGEAIKKSNRMLGYIVKSVEFKTREVMLRLYNALVRPHLEYCVQFWAPHFQKDIAALEAIQRRASRLFPGLSYSERLSELNLFTLEQRRLRGDLIQVFKIIKGINHIKPEELFQISRDTRTRDTNGNWASRHSRWKTGDTSSHREFSQSGTNFPGMWLKLNIWEHLKIDWIGSLDHLVINGHQTSMIVRMASSHL